MANLQQTRYDKLIRRVANIVGAGAIVTETLQEVFPVLDLENVPGELMVLGGWRLAHRGTDITAGGAQQTASQLFNPVDSGQVIVVTRVIVTLDALDTLGMRLDTTPLTSSNGFGQFRDARAGDPITDASVGNTRIQTPLAITPLAEFRVAGDDPFFLEDKNDVAVLMPGNGLTFGTGGNGRRLLVSYWWRERVLEAAEFVS